MKRIATIAAVLTTGVVAVPVAAGGNTLATANTQVVRQVVGTKVANAHRVNAAVTIQRHQVQIVQAQRWAQLRAQIR